MNGLFVGANRIRLKSTPSTNSYASELLKNQPPMEGTMIWTEEQTHGRGQRGNFWTSAPGKNLTFSLILYPSFLNAAQFFSLSKAVALGIRDFLTEKTVQPVKVKWPNDLYIGTKKVGGILVESGFRNNSMGHAVVGIGLNINQLDFGPELPNASSLAQITGQRFDCAALLDRLCTFLNARYLRLKADPFGMDEEYLHALLGFRQWHHYRKGEEGLIAQVTGVEPDGRLGLLTLSGDHLKADFKSIEFIPGPPAILR
ncbi:MAG: biotin--[acetyl-CoA-carboxylase] ligase [Salibacteraceae bacterium]